MWCYIMQEASFWVEDDSLRKTGFGKVIAGFGHEAFSVLLSAVAKEFKERAQKLMDANDSQHYGHYERKLLVVNNESATLLL